MTDHFVVFGVDGFKSRWVAVELFDGRFARAFVVDRLTQLRDERAAWIGVDVPIGLVETGRRPADLTGRSLLGKRASSLFMTPPRAVLKDATYAVALATARGLPDGRGITRQAFALFPKILEAEAARVADGRLFEVHPELSFRALVGQPMTYPKRSWNGQHERRAALQGAGIALDDYIDVAGSVVPPDDLLDAAIAAWSADRLARGLAESIPDSPGTSPGEPGLIWA